jgi:uncharacterized protein YndB with AHSA1/START domain
MYEIRHRVGVNASRTEVWEKLTTIEGLASWWTRDVTGDPSEGGDVAFYFGSPEPSVVMHVVKTTDDHVEWVCAAGPDEWFDNTVTFDLEQNGAETVVKFAHAWREPVEFTAHCSTKWAFFLLGMKASLEGGAGTPFPGELQISSWG